MAKTDIKSQLVKKFESPFPEFYKRRIVFWEDPTREFEADVDSLDLENVKIVKLEKDGNYYSIKKRLLVDDPESDYLIYQPFSYDNLNEEDWLLDIEKYSETFRADFFSLLMDELGLADDFSVLKEIRKFEVFFKNQVRKEKFLSFHENIRTSTDLDRVIYASLVNSKNTEWNTIVMTLLSQGLEDEKNASYQNIVRFGNLEVFWDLVSKTTGYSEQGNLRKLMTTILVTAMGTSVSNELLQRTFPMLFKAKSISRCYAMVSEWLSANKDDRSVEDLISEVGEELGLSSLLKSFAIPELIKGDIFPQFDECLLKRTFEEMQPTLIKPKEILSMIEKRRLMTWYSEYRVFYEGLSHLAKMEGLHQKWGDVFHFVGAPELWNRYAEEFYAFDSEYRHFHRCYGKAQRDTKTDLLDDFGKCVDYVENLYSNYFLNGLSMNWIRLAKENLTEKGQIPSTVSQLDFFSRELKPNIGKKLLVVIISDALRYEVGKELAEELEANNRGKATIGTMETVFPSITKFGMAALLPGQKTMDEEGIILSDGLPTETTKQREKVLQKHVPESAAVSANDFLKMKKDERVNLVKGKKLLYIYHNEIDATGDDPMKETQVFDACDRAIQSLVALVSQIISLRPSSDIYITADHGFLYNYNSLPETQRASYGGISDNAFVGRRYVYAKEKLQMEFLLPVCMRINDSANNYVGYSPMENVRIKLRGKGENYVHGGVSLQETMIPLIHFENIRTNSKEYQENADLYDSKSVTVRLTNPTRRITSSFVSLSFLQNDPVGGKILPAKLQVFFTNEAGKKVSTTAELIADKKEQDPSQRTIKVKVEMHGSEISNLKKVFLNVLDEKTGLNLCTEDSEWTVMTTIIDDFGL